MADILSTGVEIIRAGGFLMLPLAALALYLYYSGFEIFFRMRRWNKICSNADTFKSAFSAFLAAEFSNGGKNADIKKQFSHLRLLLMSGVNRRLFTLKVLSGVPPLIGLLGTVSGMMLSISSAAGSSASVADGISVALITTQAGLTVAIPAWIIAMAASSQTQKLLINIARRETAIIRGAA